TIGEIRRAWLQHAVVFFRHVDLTPADYLGFAGRFARIADYPMLQGLREHPQIVEVKKLPQERHNFGGIWHSDTSYLETPPIGTMLLAREVPEFGGDTLFANMYLAYETLSPGMQKLLAPLRAVNVSSKSAANLTRADRMQTGAKIDAARDEFVAVHPVVRTHSETGKQLLYVNVAHTTHFEGMTEAESAPLLEWLYEHQTRPEFTCRFSWQRGSLAFWDNRACQHHPINDYHGQLRVMHRISLGAEQPS
ncbi:MAG: TauD/TfdA family dioxygenase, partial [Gammaproteobacteria bacterium]|nr:TauD/TfdA family dioxygenase [Gammaproteobacteria bacterium]